MRRIKEIKSTLEQGEEGAAEIRAAARQLEKNVPVGEVLAAIAHEEFPLPVIAASRRCEGPEERAWLTLAAAGPRRARLVLAWRASQLLDPVELASVASQRAPGRGRKFERLVNAAEEPAAAAAWRLLAHLEGSELRALVEARPALAAAGRRSRSGKSRVGARALSPALGVS